MFPEETSVKNFVSFPEFDLKTGDETAPLEEVSITQWVYIHMFDNKSRLDCL